MERYSLKALEHYKNRFAYTNNFKSKSKLVKKYLVVSTSLNLIIIFGQR